MLTVKYVAPTELKKFDGLNFYKYITPTELYDY
jgi:hypothetical protein